MLHQHGKTLRLLLGGGKDPQTWPLLAGAKGGLSQQASAPVQVPGLLLPVTRLTLSLQKGGESSGCCDKSVEENSDGVFGRMQNNVIWFVLAPAPSPLQDTDHTTPWRSFLCHIQPFTPSSSPAGVQEILEPPSRRLSVSVFENTK